MFKGENPTYFISYSPSPKQRFNVGLYSDIYRPVSFKLGMMMEASKLYILISAWTTLILMGRRVV